MSRQASSLFAPLLSCFVLACGTDPAGTGPGSTGNSAGNTGVVDAGSTGSDPANTGSTGVNGGSGAGPGGGDSGGAGSGPGAGADSGLPPSPDAVRFLVLGDAGTGDDNQRKVAAAMRDVCAERGCQFALYLGDNIYESGVTGTDDAQFKLKFEDPYVELDFPFYVVLGNHDYSGAIAGTGFDTDKSDYQVDYTMQSEKWKMPSHFYTFEVGPVAFFGLDTNAIVHNDTRPASQQQPWLEEAMANSKAPWKIVMGHHPFISNGSHGNAGNYDGTVLDTPFSQTGAYLEDMFNASVCGKAQIYFSGHDHNREWLEPTCGTTFIVSGAGAKLRDLANRDDQATRFVDDKQRGFMWVEIKDDLMTGVFYGDDGVIDYEDTVAR